jgi:hypothetical protein
MLKQTFHGSRHNGRNTEEDGLHELANMRRGTRRINILGLDMDTPRNTQATGDVKRWQEG